MIFELVDAHGGSTIANVEGLEAGWIQLHADEARAVPFR
jgi:hypothetical protein